ncbi:carbohydrate ABC transporter permease [Cohnella thailandensis]|uniref:Sugar ABC transporter permease n=1 Tax=Cohnella thailandensis TaxID=557557 RepID=A0A841ST77_9BACL|nr:sugar ABC transporter permease [Cohnella thailandensis]MBB6633796.1 sugar ABC transporter permease [Cohnella thailandensis]MBP1976587.1 multiple sugar transport system permease protein [Cohnella thailandensis]
MLRRYFHNRPHLVYIGPALLILGILTFVPTIFLYGLSLTNYELGYPDFKFVGIDNFVRLFSGQDAEFWYSVRISLGFMIIVTVIELLLGFGLAVLLDREFKLKPLAFACLIVPIAMTPSITGQIWKLMLNAENGVVNYLLGFVGGKVIWLSAENAFLSTVLVDVWQNTPFVALIIYAGMRSLPSEPYEAAAIDGANRTQIFRYITLPLLLPMILLAVVFRAIDSLKTFDIPYSLTQGGPGSSTEFLSMHVYRLGFAQTGWVGRSAAVSVVLLVLITVISWFLIRAYRKGVENRG